MALREISQNIHNNDRRDDSWKREEGDASLRMTLLTGGSMIKNLNYVL